MDKQKRLDINWYAGVADTVVYYLSGDQTARKHSFVVKADKEETSDRLIEKTSDAGEISATYEGGKTKIEITLLKEDTYDLGGNNYYWDHRSNSETDETDTKVPVRGNFNVEGAVQTPYDGANLPSAAARYALIDLSTFSLNDIIGIKQISGSNVMAGFNLTDLINLLFGAGRTSSDALYWNPDTSRFEPVTNGKALVGNNQYDIGIWNNITKQYEPMDINLLRSLLGGNSHGINSSLFNIFNPDGI